MKYVLVSGGVISGVGKGIIASSTGLLLKTMGLKHVSSIKIDPYLNVDAGTMNPREHGEVFVLDDGGEVDLDLGNYERYLNITLTRENNITTGKIYQHVINEERRGAYLGKTVQVVPHVVDAIQQWIERVAKIPVDDTAEEPDVCIIELGGTVGDIESAPFVEAMTQLRRTAKAHNFLQIHVSYIPLIEGEQKTKPTQQAIKSVRSAGLFPDLIACRCQEPLEPSAREKIARFCQVTTEAVIGVRNMPNTYQVPMLLEQQGLKDLVCDILKLDLTIIPKSLVHKGSQTWEEWKSLCIGLERYFEPVNIVLVGKYVELHDSYLSVVRSLEHAGMHCKRKVSVTWVDASHLEEAKLAKDPASFHKAWHNICTASGILIPGGFGHRGCEGMIKAAQWARENKVPYLGICLGMQIAVLEAARNLCDIPTATSGEFLNDNASLNPNAEKIIIEMPEIDQVNKGGTMRLGLRPTIYQPGSEWSKLRALYGEKSVINERHRHRYEVNPDYVERLQNAGLNFVGKDEAGVRMEIVELKDHPWFVGVQFHPEYLSRVLHPSRPYLGFVAASAGCLEEVTRNILQSTKPHLTNGVNGY